MRLLTKIIEIIFACVVSLAESVRELLWSPRFWLFVCFFAVAPALIYTSLCSHWRQTDISRMGFPLFQQILFFLCSWYWFIGSHLSASTLPLFSVNTVVTLVTELRDGGTANYVIGSELGGVDWHEYDESYFLFLHNMHISWAWDFQVVYERSMSLVLACECTEGISHLALVSLAWLVDAIHRGHVIVNHAHAQKDTQAITLSFSLSHLHTQQH